MKTRIIFGLFVVCVFLISKNYGQEFYMLDTSKATLSGYSAKIEGVPGLDGNDKAIVIVNPKSATGTTPPPPVAAWFRQGFWWVSNTDQTPMQTGKYFEVQFWRNPTANAFAHKATPQNLVNGKSRIDHPALDNRPNAALAVYQSYSNNNGGIITPYVAIQEYNDAEKKWYLVNAGGQPISAGNSYSIVVISSGALGGREELEKPVGITNQPTKITPPNSSPTGNAGGDLGGNYPNPNVVGLQGKPLANIQPKVGDTLKWDGTQWKPDSSGNTAEPLKFNQSLGKKIILYPGATGDVGVGVAGNLLQIYSDKPDADVAIGYDQAGTFNEKLRVKGNGAIAVGGDAGQPGQVLTSNGAGSAPTWKPAGGGGTGIQVFFKTPVEPTAGVELGPLKANEAKSVDSIKQTITVARRSNVLVSAYVNVIGRGCFACADPTGEVWIDIAGPRPMISKGFQFWLKPETIAPVSISNYLFTLDAGTYTVSLILRRDYGDARGAIQGRGVYSSILVLPIE